MKRFSTSEKTRINNLLKQGKSLKQISKKFGVGKTSIYYYMRRLNGRKIKLVTINNSNQEKIGEFIGLFAGDGSYFFDKPRYIHRIRIHLNKTEINIINHYTNVMSELFGKPPSHVNEKSCITLEIRSRDVIDFIKFYLNWHDKKTYTVRLRKKLNTLSKDFLIGFLRGLIDSDGYVRKKRREIYFGTTSVNLHKNFIDSLKNFDFKFKVYKQETNGKKLFYKTRLTNTEVIKFIKLVKPIKADGLAGI